MMTHKNDRSIQRKTRESCEFFLKNIYTIGRKNIDLYVLQQTSQKLGGIFTLKYGQGPK
mgnify:CR=1 FL=1